MGRSKLFELFFFLSPMILIVVLFYLVPLIVSLYASFTPTMNWNLKYLHDFIGVYNYERLIHMMRYDPSFKSILETTVVFVIITLMINIIGGLLLALGTFFIREDASTLMRVIWLLPRMTPVAVFGLLWYYFFHNSEIGTLNSILMKLGIIDSPVAWGQRIPWGAWGVIIFVNAIVGVSYGMLVFSSALSHIPRELVIAARVDGASNWEISRKILIPMIKWHIMYATIWQLMSLLLTYFHLYPLVAWGIVNNDYGSTLALYVYTTAFGRGRQEQGLAAAAATLLSILGVSLGFLILKVMKFEEMMREPRGDL